MTSMSEWFSRMSKGLSKGKKIVTLIGALASGVVPAISAETFQHNNVLYQKQGNAIIAIDSPDYKILQENQKFFVDLNGNTRKDRFESYMPTGEGSFTDEAIKTLAFAREKTDDGVKEAGFFTYFSERQKERNLFTIWGDGTFSMGPYQFVFNDSKRALFYDVNNNGFVDDKDEPMGSRFNSTAVSQLAEISRLAEQKTDAEKRLQETESALARAQIREEITSKEAEIQRNGNEISNNGSEYVPAQLPDSVSKLEYDKAVAELKDLTSKYNAEKQNYDRTTQTLNSKIRELEGDLSISRERVNELEEMVGIVNISLDNSRKRLTEAEKREAVYLEQLQELSDVKEVTKGMPVEPIISSSGEETIDAIIEQTIAETTEPTQIPSETDEQTQVATAEVEKTIEELYLQGEMGYAEIESILEEETTRKSLELIRDEPVSEESTRISVEPIQSETEEIKELSGKLPLSFVSAITFSGNHNSLGARAGVKLGYEENLLNGAVTIGYQKGISNETANTTSTEQDPTSAVGLYGVRMTDTTTQNTDYNALEIALSGYIGNEKVKAVLGAMYRHVFYNWLSVKNELSQVKREDLVLNENSYSTTSSGNGHDNLVGAYIGLDFKTGPVRPEIDVGVEYSTSSGKFYPYFAAGLTVAEPSKYKSK